MGFIRYAHHAEERLCYWWGRIGAGERKERIGMGDGVCLCGGHVSLDAGEVFFAGGEAGREGWFGEDGGECDSAGSGL